MESLQNIKRRLKGVQNINQITKAMELVAATKMRKSQDIALRSRPYAYAALELLANLSSVENAALPALFERRTVKATAYVLVTSDKGLAGSFNSSVIRAFETYIRENKLDLEEMKKNDHFVAVGQKAAAYLEKNMKLCEKFVRVGDYTTVEEVRPIADLLVSQFLKDEWDRVLVFSMNFNSALAQNPVHREIFPIDLAAIRQTLDEIIPKTGKFSAFAQTKTEKEPRTEYLIEPSPQGVLSELANHLVLMQIYHLVLEANASEHAARRLAMKNASDNANDLANELTLAYNKSRQASITREIIEIVGGAESLK